MDKHPVQHLFNLGNPEIVTVKEWVTLCYEAVGKLPTFVSMDQTHHQRDYFCFYDYEYVLDVSRQNSLMPVTLSLKEGLREEYVWYKDHPESVYNRKPYLEYIERHISVKL